MLSKTESSAKRPINLSLTAKTVDMAKELGINLSQTVDSLLGDAVKKRYWEKWREDNMEAMLAYNERVAREGLALERYRSFAVGISAKRDKTD